MAKKPDSPERSGVTVDEVTGMETTGHTWNGIGELNTPLPRWWLWTFYATVLFSIGYTIAYPAWPLINTATTGVLGWSSRGELAKSMEAADAAQANRIAAIEATDVTDILADSDLRTFAIAGGSAAYKVNCVQCHGSGAQGSRGYPNLNDDDWIWGGSADEIYQTILHGIRFEADDDTRFGEMPAFGSDELLTREQVSDVAWYVRQLSDQEFDQQAAARGEELFVDNCAACHGDVGEGIRETGGPNLSDAIWLYGGDHAEIVAQINRPSHGVMPGWKDRLNDVTLKQLAVYVHSLGGGE